MTRDQIIDAIQDHCDGVGSLRAGIAADAILALAIPGPQPGALGREIGRLRESVIAQGKLTLAARTQRDAYRRKLDEARKALEAVETWWLSDGMAHFDGAPYAMFAVRAALTEGK